MKGQDIAVSGVDDDFTTDVPLQCYTKTGAAKTRWVRLSSGTNALEFPSGTVCELPATTDFLYLSGR
jgi:hypothetical protein